MYVITIFNFPNANSDHHKSIFFSFFSFFTTTPKINYYHLAARNSYNPSKRVGNNSAFLRAVRVRASEVCAVLCSAKKDIIFAENILK